MPRSTKYFRYYTYIEPVIKNPIIKTYGYAIFTIAMTTVFIVFAIKPTLETIAVLQKKQENQAQVLSKIDKKIADLQTAQKNYINIDSNSKSKIQNLVPDQTSLPALISSLEGATLGTEATISALQFQPIVIEKPKTDENLSLKEIPFTFNIEGSYATLKQILKSLKENSRIITISNLSFNKVTGGKTLLMSVTGKAYYLK